MKSLDQFNLNISTPEGEEKDPELIRLRAELMAFKPLLDDALRRQSVSEAEEIFAQAKEAKAKLKAYKESLNKFEKKEYKTIEIDGITLELSPVFDKITWNDIPEKLEELNKNLKPGEKPWRLLTEEEFLQIFIKIKKNISMFYSLGFSLNLHYWTSTKYAENSVWTVYCKHAGIGRTNEETSSLHSVRFFR